MTQNTLTLRNLIEEFQSLKSLTGADKTTSYEVKVWVDLYAGWTLELGTYDIGEWPRHTKVGTFDTEEEMLTAFAKKIEGAREEIARWALEVRSEEVP